MNDLPSQFTVGVFQDVAWAEKGIAALMRLGFAPGALTVIAKSSPEAASLIEKTLGAAPATLSLAGIGDAVGRGSLVAALDGSGHDLARIGLAGTMRRVGFQPHDGRIYDALTARGGVLVAIEDEPRAADALATLHSYGGGNAAIGAWTGRV
jgi:hypothetical protein